MNRSDRDPIVAIATAHGEAAIGIVRLSGRESVEIVGQHFRGKQSLGEAKTHTLLRGQFVVQSQVLDEVLASVMWGPGSYTGETVVELNCHGGPFVLQKVVEALLESGARYAEPGEFTKRAFLNGKLDLSQAEAVADVVSARTEIGLQSAFFQVRGGLRGEYESIAEELREALVLLEAGLDFSEDVQVESDRIAEPLSRARDRMRRLIASHGSGKLVREGAVVVIAGAPNVGKSSLLNRLLEEDRAIVTEIPGTTRDTIEETVNLGGIPVRLVDTAGLRETLDPVEAEGARRSRLRIDSADLVLRLVDGSLGRRDSEKDLGVNLRGSRSILVLNKSDLGIDGDWEDVEEATRISALTGKGLLVLRERIVEELVGGEPPMADSVTNARHYAALVAAVGSLEAAQNGLAVKLPGELVAVDLKAALDELEDIVGSTTAEDVLDRIFSSFCIGK